nr:CHASE domain-containing protein [Tepidiforma sp.]
MTGTVELVRDGAPGFILFVPVYAERPAPLEPERRRGGDAGWVFAVFAQEEFFRGALGAMSPEVEITGVRRPAVRRARCCSTSGGRRGAETVVRRAVLGGRRGAAGGAAGAAFPAANAALRRW